MDNPINYWYQKYLALKAKMDEMMKEAVDVEVLQVTRKRPPVVVIRLDENKYKDGDKVRVIILPKED